MSRKMRLKELRLANGVTQNAVASVIRCAKSTYPKYERGEREPSLEILLRLADYYHVTLDYLVGRKNNN